MSAWRPALRIARRDVLKAKGRSLLVAVMVGVPVMLVTCFTAVYATDQVSAAESIPSRVGATAAELQLYSNLPVWQDPTMNQYDVVRREGDDGGAPPDEPSTADAVALLQQLTGGRVIDVPTASTLIRTERGRLDASALVADVRHRALSGLVDVQQGRLPQQDDEVLVSRDLKERGFDIGDTVALADGSTPATVVGIGEVPYPGARHVVVALPGLHLATAEASHRYLLDRAAPLTWPEVQRLNKSGVLAFSRHVVEHPPGDWKSTLPAGAQVWEGGLSSADTAVLALVIFSIVLEVILLAGPAFAVGVRRQQRQLALVAATGGSARDVRRVVLAQGIAIGAGASLLGAGLGIGVARLLVWALTRFRGTRLGPWDVDWRAAAAAFVLGAVAAVVAAWVPARSAARADVVAVLAGRRGQVRSRRGWPLAGLLLVLIGLAVVFGVGTKPGGEFGVAGGTLVMVLGAIAAMPAVIGLVGRLGARLPLPLRLAARDSARQRGRTAPAVAAVMAAVAGVTALAIGGSSDNEQRRLEYEPRQPAGVTTVQTGDLDAAGWAAVDRIVQQQTGRGVAPTGVLGRPLNRQLGYEPLSVYVAPSGCPTTPPDMSASQIDDRCASWQLDGATLDSWAGRGSIVADADVVAKLGYAVGAEQRQVLANGGVLVPSQSLVHDGTATVTVYRTTDNGAPTDMKQMTVPAAYLPARDMSGTPELVDLVLTPASAQEHGFSWVRDGGVLLADPGTPPLTKDAEDRLHETLAGMTPYIDVYTERGFVSDMSLPLLGLTIIGGLAVLVGTLTATGLALADSRPDLATLAAVGARPRTRRVMAAAQALVIGLLGAVSGVLVGLVPGIAVTWPLTATSWSEGGQDAHGPIIDVPWMILLGIGLAVPVVAALFAGTAVRSRLPLTRRVGQ
jgi:putative ABC transport system permease protein